MSPENAHLQHAKHMVDPRSLFSAMDIKRVMPCLSGLVVQEPATIHMDQVVMTGQINQLGNSIKHSGRMNFASAPRYG